MNHDEDFARTLRDRLDAVAPLVEVDTTRVVPRARRHRTRVRSVGAVAAVAVLVGGGWFVDTKAWHSVPQLEPAAPTSHAVEGEWWYTRSETTGVQEHVDELWRSRTGPGLIVSDGDLTTSTAIGPSDDLGGFTIDGTRVERLTDLSLLPTDAASLAAVLQETFGPVPGQEADVDDAVFNRAYILVAQAGLLPRALREAAWDVAAALPSSAVSIGSDSRGRPGEVLVHTLAEGGTQRLVRDPATGFLLEEVASDGSRVYLENRAVTEIPVEPTLESAGCTSWEDC